MARDNYTFHFDKEAVERIKQLNDTLKKEEKRIYEFSLQLRRSLNFMKNEKQIDDFNIFQEYSLFSKNEECNKRNNVEEGDPIWMDKASSHFIHNKKEHDLFFMENWNELAPEHPLGNLEFCYSMHCICFHSRLSWQDLIDVDDVWIELKVDYQFLVKMVKKEQ